MMNQPYEHRTLSPLANLIVDRAIENTNRKLVAGFRNKKNSQPNAKSPDPLQAGKDTLAATSAQSAMQVANRGVAWKEILFKSLSAGIGSLATLQFDGALSVSANDPSSLNELPDKPGVYVVYDANGNLAYIGDSTNMRQRWQDGHMNEYRGRAKSENRKPYKLAGQLEDGCTIKFVVMDSAETAAALEAFLIKNEKPPVNRKEELKEEQGIRSNIEAKKMKDSMGSAGEVAMGAGKEALKNSGWQVFEQLTAAAIIAIKDELVDLFMGGTTRLKARVERFLKKIWAVVERIVAATARPIKALIGDGSFLRGLKAEQFTDETFGVPTVRDILKELEKPGRDPRPEFKAARFADGVEDIKDLREGMVLEGVVSNVAAFGAFVDIGVHQDGLIHISALSDTYVKDPRDVVKAGDIVKVKVLEVDVPRKRIALTRRLDDTPGQATSRPGSRDERSQGQAPRRDAGNPGQGRGQGRNPGTGGRPAPAAPPANNALAEAFARAKRS